MLTVEKLKAFGADVDGGLRRCMDNESFYLRLVQMIIDDNNFVVLREALEQRDRARAFMAAHALKGILGNLSLTPLYRPAFELTELLRGEGGDPVAIDEKFRELLAGREALRRIAEEK